MSFSSLCFLCDLLRMIAEELQHSLLKKTLAGDRSILFWNLYKGKSHLAVQNNKNNHHRRVGQAQGGLSGLGSCWCFVLCPLSWEWCPCTCLMCCNGQSKLVWRKLAFIRRTTVAFLWWWHHSAGCWTHLELLEQRSRDSCQETSREWLAANAGKHSNKYPALPTPAVSCSPPYFSPNHVLFSELIL